MYVSALIKFLQFGLEKRLREKRGKNRISFYEHDEHPCFCLTCQKFNSTVGGIIDFLTSVSVNPLTSSSSQYLLINKDIFYDLLGGILVLKLIMLA